MVAGSRDLYRLKVLRETVGLIKNLTRGGTTHKTLCLRSHTPGAERKEGLVDLLSESKRWRVGPDSHRRLGQPPHPEDAGASVSWRPGVAPGGLAVGRRSVAPLV